MQIRRTKEAKDFGANIDILVYFSHIRPKCILFSFTLKSLYRVGQKKGASVKWS